MKIKEFRITRPIPKMELKEVISVLKAENYFTKDDIVNLESGMIIRLTPRGIKETIGKGNRWRITYKIIILK